MDTTRGQAVRSCRTGGTAWRRKRRHGDERVGWLSDEMPEHGSSLSYMVIWRTFLFLLHTQGHADSQTRNRGSHLLRHHRAHAVRHRVDHADPTPEFRWMASFSGTLTRNQGVKKQQRTATDDKERFQPQRANRAGWSRGRAPGRTRCRRSRRLTNRSADPARGRTNRRKGRPRS